MLRARTSEVLFEIAGVDLSQIAGIQPYTMLMFLAETGTDMSPWGSGKRFASWLGLCPGTKVASATLQVGNCEIELTCDEVDDVGQVAGSSEAPCAGLG